MPQNQWCYAQRTFTPHWKSFRVLLLILMGLSSAPLVFPQAPAPQREDYERRRQLLNEIVWPSHEPLMFLRRHRGGAVDPEKNYLRYHTDENVRKIAATGLRMSRILHFCKGFGLAAEQAEIERTVELASLFHKHGLKVPVYIVGRCFPRPFSSRLPKQRNGRGLISGGNPLLIRFTRRRVTSRA